ncbi:MAG: hypothetical protein GC161_09410 [Planctomycetaceae bacterium]|nr:hypothetical protein [Planctomycetaceae bacterium]
MQSAGERFRAPNLRVTAAALVVANLVPLFGALFLDWSVYELMALFWFENLILGAINVVRLLTVAPTDKVPLPAKLFLVPFFCVHYGLFTFVHGTFVVSLFSRDSVLGGGSSGGLSVPALADVSLLALVGLAASHLISLVVHWFRGGERRRATAQLLMFRPYGRVVVLHVVILAGGGLVLALGEPIAALALLVVLKTATDLVAHRLEHRKVHAEPSAAAAT